MLLSAGLYKPPAEHTGTNLFQTLVGGKEEGGKVFAFYVVAEWHNKELIS